MIKPLFNKLNSAYKVLLIKKFEDKYELEQKKTIDWAKPTDYWTSSEKFRLHALI